MKRSYIVLGSVSLAALGLTYLVTSATKTAEASITLKPNEPEVVSLGKQVYAQNCASCHGVVLEGQDRHKSQEIMTYHRNTVYIYMTKSRSKKPKCCSRNLILCSITSWILCAFLFELRNHNINYVVSKEFNMEKNVK